MTDVFNGVDTDQDGSGAPITATGPIIVTFSGTKDKDSIVVLTMYSRSDAAAFAPFPMRSQFGLFKVNLANALELGRPVKLDNSDLFLEYSRKNSFHISWFKKQQRTIENHLHNHFQEPIKITIQVIETEDDEKVSNPDEPLDKNSANKMIKDDPLLNKLVEDLGLELT